jgi:hypothetical protein
MRTCWLKAYRVSLWSLARCKTKATSMSPNPAQRSKQRTFGEHVGAVGCRAWRILASILVGVQKEICSRELIDLGARARLKSRMHQASLVRLSSILNSRGAKGTCTDISTRLEQISRPFTMLLASCVIVVVLSIMDRRLSHPEIMNLNPIHSRCALLHAAPRIASNAVCGW